MDVAGCMASIRRKDPYTQIALGAAAGLLTGFVTMKIGKLAAVAVGSVVILLEIAHIEGIIKFEWSAFSKLFEGRKDHIQTSSALIDQAKDFARSNVIFAVAFVGGTFMGIGLS